MNEVRERQPVYSDSRVLHVMTNIDSKGVGPVGLPAINNYIVVFIIIDGDKCVHPLILKKLDMGHIERHMDIGGSRGDEHLGNEYKSKTVDDSFHIILPADIFERI